MTTRNRNTLVLNPFGSAIFVGNGININSANTTESWITSNDFEFHARVNHAGTISIAMEPNMRIRIAVHCHDRDVTSIWIDTGNRLHMGDQAWLRGHELVHNPAQSEAQPITGVFRLRLLESRMIRRFDVRYNNNDWLTTLVMNGRVWTIVTNGQEFCIGLQTMLETAVQRGRTALVRNEAPNQDFGLSVDIMTREERLRRENEERRRRQADQQRLEDARRAVRRTPSEPTREVEGQHGHGSRSVAGEMPSLVPWRINPIVAPVGMQEMFEDEDGARGGDVPERPVTAPAPRSGRPTRAEGLLLEEMYDEADDECDYGIASESGITNRE